MFAFVMEVEGMDFRQALEHLARKAGVDLSMYKSEGSQKIAERKKRLYHALELAASYYYQSLLKNHHALEYVFKKRRLSKEIVQDFKIGYAPTSGDALVLFLTRKGFSKSELDDAGLVNRFGGDLFRGRMMVPLMDGTGQVVGFTARIIADDDPKAPKYLNTPQTLLYDKSRHVFGLSQAKEAIRKNDYAVIVEGNLDVVSSHQVGTRQVVATAGTALTESHLRALARLSGNIRLSFDGDKAGLAATERSIPIAQMVGVDIKVITLPGDAKDPDELIQMDPALWQKAIDDAQPVMDWVLDQHLARNDMATAAGKRAFTTATLAIVRTLHDPVEQEHYMKKIALASDVSLEALGRKLTQTPAEEAKPLKQLMTPQQTATAAKSYDKKVGALLSAVLVDRDVQELFKTIDPRTFAGEAERAVVQYIIDHLGTVVDVVPPELQEYDKYVTMLLLNPDTEKLEWSEQSRLATAREVLRTLQANYQKTETKEDLIRQEAEARKRGEEDVANKLLMQINQLIRGEK